MASQVLAKRLAISPDPFWGNEGVHRYAQKIHWLRACLTSQADSLVTASSMAHGLELMPLVLPHLILLDAALVTGKPDACFLALREQSPSAAILLVVPRCSPAEQAEYLTWPADAHLLKPYSIAVLNKMVADLLADVSSGQ